MQLNLIFEEPQQTVQIQTQKYFYTVTWEEKVIEPKNLTYTGATRIRTAHAVYTSIEQVHDFIRFIQTCYSYNGCHIITRHTEKPNLNCSSRKPYILLPG